MAGGVGHAGTLRYYGTPAEEGGSGKVYMVRDGLFKDVDVAVSWHPGDRNEASPTSSTANITGKFRFHGVAAHAAAAPERGRSALDAVEAMDNMVNMMREHVPQETRIHYIITRGGAAPNIVPDFAEAYYYARHPNMPILDGIWERIVNAAKGAALGTGTTMDLEITGAVYNVLPNTYLSGLMNTNLEKVGGFTYTPEEIKFAEELRKTLTDPPDVADRLAGEGAADARGADQQLVDRLRRRQLERAVGVDDRRDVRARRPRAQLAGDRVRRRHDRRQGDDGRGEDDGADDGGSVHRSGAHPEGEGGVRPEARAELRLQDAARGSQAGAGLSQVVQAFRPACDDEEKTAEARRSQRRSLQRF